MVFSRSRGRRKIHNNMDGSIKRSKRKRFFLTRILPFILLVLYTVWISQSLEQSIQEHHHNQFNGRVLVCVTGQVERLILTKKVETILVPLQKKYGFVVDVALSLTENDSHYTNPENGKVSAPEFSSYASAKAFLENHDEFFRVLTPTPIAPLNATSDMISPQYLGQMDKRDMPSDWQRRRVENHARQYHALAQCAAATDNFDQYKFVVRIRDDVVLDEPLQHLSQLRQLLETYPIVTSDCRTHGGMNDRMALVASNAAKEYFERPLQNFYSTNSLLHPSVHNPESYLYYTYQEPPAAASDQDVIWVAQTPLLRGIFKYVTNYKGEAVLAQKEDNLFCPTRWSKFLDLFRN